MIVVFEPGLNAVERRGCNSLPNHFLRCSKPKRLQTCFFFPGNDRFHSWDAEQNVAPPDCDSTHSWLRHPHAALIAPRQDKLEKKTKKTKTKPVFYALCLHRTGPGCSGAATENVT